MPVQERRKRAEYLRWLRRQSRMPPAYAWHTVKPRSKANETCAAELCRREIRWLEEAEYDEKPQRPEKRGLFDGLFG